MKICKKPNFVLEDPSDLARLLGLPPRSPRPMIEAAFGRATGCEAELDLLEEILSQSGSESWEVRIIRELPQCRIELRQGSRGAWLTRAEMVPQDVLGFFAALSDRSGRIVTRRSWKCWQRQVLMGRLGRRLKSKAGELVACVTIENVRRPTGEVRHSLLIRAIGAPFPDLVAPVRLEMPLRAADLSQSVGFLKSQSEAQMDMAA